MMQSQKNRLEFREIRDCEYVLMNISKRPIAIEDYEFLKSNDKVHLEECRDGGKRKSKMIFTLDAMLTLAEMGYDMQRLTDIPRYDPSHGDVWC